MGLHRTDWSLPRTEVGYWVRTSEVGKGYATEGVHALTARSPDGRLRSTCLYAKLSGEG